MTALPSMRKTVFAQRDSHAPDGCSRRNGENLVPFAAAGFGGTSEQVGRFLPEGSLNMRTSTAYFAGAGTVIAAIVGGVGGGLLIADMVSPKSPKQGVEQTRLERRTSPAPIEAANAPSQPVQYLAVPQLPAPSSAVAAAQPQPQADSSSPAPTVSAAAPPASQPAPAVQAVAHEQAAATDDAVAKARDAEAKRVTEKRKADRRQQWAEKRRYQRQEQELRSVEEKVREETETRREYAAEPVRMEMRSIRLFDPE
jgi:hypothetical protein